MGGLLYGLGFPLGVMLYADKWCGGDRGSLSIPKLNIGDMYNLEFIGDANISSFARILAESWIDKKFVE